MEEKKVKVYKWGDWTQLPIYIKELTPLPMSMNEMAGPLCEIITGDIKEPEHKILEIRLATLIEESQIQKAPGHAQDEKGIIIPRMGRIKDMHLPTTQLILTPDVTPEDYCKLFHLFMARILTPYGILCFWGRPLEQSLWIMSNRRSKGICAFLNWKKATYINELGQVVPMNKNFIFVRVDSILKENDKLKMGREELYSFLAHHCLHLNSYALRLLAGHFSGTIISEKSADYFPISTAKARPN